jgi:uncharacterized protein YecT (DUF1311 family)
MGTFTINEKTLKCYCSECGREKKEPYSTVCICRKISKKQKKWNKDYKKALEELG